MCLFFAFCNRKKLDIQCVGPGVSHAIDNSSINLVWNLEVMDPGKETFDFSREIDENFFIIQAKILMTFFSHWLKDVHLKKYHLDVHSGQIVVFFFNTDYIPTHFLCKIGFNNISWPIHNHPCGPPVQNLGVTTPRIDAYDWRMCWLSHLPCVQ